MESNIFIFIILCFVKKALSIVLLSGTFPTMLAELQSFHFAAPLIFLAKGGPHSCTSLFFPLSHIPMPAVLTYVCL